MKTIVACFGLALASAVSLPAQFFRPETVSGAIIGGVAGAVIGHNDDRHGWEGAAYGAAAGALIGTWVGESRDRHGVRVPRPVYRVDRYGHSSRHRSYDHFAESHPFRRTSHWARYHHPVASPYSRYQVWHRPDYVRSGVVIGGILGGVIGHNRDRRGWEGAAYGVGAGYLLGTIAERRAAAREEMWRRDQERVTAAVSVSSPAPTTVIHNHYYGNSETRPMTTANSLFGR